MSDAASKLARGDLAYPEAHERRVETIITRAMVEAVSKYNVSRPIQVLEVGIGSNFRVARRGLYHVGLDQLAANGVSEVHITGVDLLPVKPDIIQDAERKMKLASSESQIEVKLDAIRGSISSGLPEFSDGTFDCILCCLTLCSVDDQIKSLSEIRRLLRPNGGTFGYVEHVAVNPDEPYRLLEWQQTIFDPLQQLVAENCHLHRYTEDSISNMFDLSKENPKAEWLYRERFLVEDMWPVSCQSCGVIRRNSDAEIKLRTFDIV